MELPAFAEPSFNEIREELGFTVYGPLLSAADAATALAKLEAEVLLAHLLPRMSEAMIVNEPITWLPTPAFRCLLKLTIQFSES